MEHAPHSAADTKQPASSETPAAAASAGRGLGYNAAQKALSPRERGAQVAGLVAPLAERLSIDINSVTLHVHGAGTLGDALAYTRGTDVHLGVDEKTLGSPEGQRLIAHELTHVAQQREGRGQGVAVTTVEDSCESEADSVAERVVRGERPAVNLRASPSVRQNKKAAPKVSSLTPAEVAVAVQWYGTRPHQYTKAVTKRIQEAVGVRPDGDMGPTTIRAIAAWQSSKGLKADGYAGAVTLTAMFGEDIRRRQPAPVEGLSADKDDEAKAAGGLRRPDGLSQITETFGKPGTNIGMFAMRAGADGKMINVPAHKKVGPIFQAVFADIHKDGKSEHIHSYDGCYVYRTKRANSKSYSTHAWGIAMDVNASSNPMKKNVKPSESQKVIAPYFERHGFYWGQAFADPMHFQYCTGY